MKEITNSMPSIQVQDGTKCANIDIDIGKEGKGSSGVTANHLVMAGLNIFTPPRTQIENALNQALMRDILLLDFSFSIPADDPIAYQTLINRIRLLDPMGYVSNER